MGSTFIPSIGHRSLLWAIGAIKFMQTLGGVSQKQALSGRIRINRRPNHYPKGREWCPQALFISKVPNPLACRNSGQHRIAVVSQINAVPNFSQSQLDCDQSAETPKRL